MTKRPHDRKAPLRDAYQQDRPSRLSILFRRLRRIVPQILFIITLSGAIGGSALLFFQQFSQSRSNIFQAWLQNHTLLPINHIDIVGAKLTSTAEIEQALGAARGKPIFSFSISDAQKRLNKLLFVSRVTVQRRMPDTIRIVIEERDPMAIWQNHGTFKLINHASEPIADAFHLKDHVQAFLSLPLVVGEGADKASPEFLDLLGTFPTIKPFVAASIRVGNRRWSLLLKDDTQIYLPEGHEKVALDRLAAYQKEFRILERPVTLIDMRLPDRMVIRLRSDLNPATGHVPNARTGRTTSPISHSDMHDNSNQKNSVIQNHKPTSFPVESSLPAPARPLPDDGVPPP